MANDLGLILPEDVREGPPPLADAGAGRHLRRKLAAKIDTVIEVLVDEVDEEAPLPVPRPMRRKSTAWFIDGHFDAQPGDFLQVKVIDADHHDLYAQLALT